MSASKVHILQGTYIGPSQYAFDLRAEPKSAIPIQNSYMKRRAAIMIEWRPAPLSVDFWTSVIMSVTGCSRPLPSDVNYKVKRPLPIITVDLDSARLDDCEQEPAEVSAN